MSRRTVVVVHNHYQQAGGEDEVFRAESRLLADAGHTVIPFTVDNSSITGMNWLALAGATLWNRRCRRELYELFTREAPFVAHFHNTFPLVSPAAYYAARDAGVPVVQTLHNYRLLCVRADFFRDGRVCRQCEGRSVLWPAVAHGCYRNDRAATAVAAGMVTLHRGLRTWTEMVDVYIALSEFARRRFVAGGLPEDRIVVKPNCLMTDPGVGDHRGRFALYVGRLSPEKGLPTLLEAWRHVVRPADFTLKIVGEGPLAADLETGTSGIDYLGWRDRSEVLALMRDAAFIVVPSACYENFPLTIVEAFATGLPVIASGHGAMREIVSDHETGRHFAPGNSRQLAAALQWACTNGAQMREMGRAGRRQFERKYTAAHNHDALMQIYQMAAGRRVMPVRHGDRSTAGVAT